VVNIDIQDPAATAGLGPIADPQPYRRELLFMPGGGLAVDRIIT
jgi:hypothetical protein